ncbi:MAG: hypothetical protein ABSH50_05605 [Bryobacteraceae bacterium]|jgi:hypothetical protein
METVSHDEFSSQTTPGKQIFEGALIWSAVALSIGLLLVVLAGTIDLMPPTLVAVCRLTLTYLCAVLVLVAAGYTAIDALRARSSR